MEVKNLLELLVRIDKLYEKVIINNEDVLNDLDDLILELVDYYNVDDYNEEDKEVARLAILAITDKINLIYKVLSLDSEEVITLDGLNQEFEGIEILRFNIMNNYVMGIVRAEEINQFKDILFAFRNKLYKVNVNENNILEIAKMKSKIQHFNTEVLEDEEVLKMAFSNSN